MNDDARRRMNEPHTTGAYLEDVERADIERGPGAVQAWELGYVPLARISGNDAIRLTIDGIIVMSDFKTIEAGFGTPENSMLIDALTNYGRAHDPLDDTYHEHPFTLERLQDFEHDVQRTLRAKAQFIPDPDDARDRWFMKTRNGVAANPYEQPDMRIKTAPNQARAIGILAERYARLRE